MDFLHFSEGVSVLLPQARILFESLREDNVSTLSANILQFGAAFEPEGYAIVLRESLERLDSGPTTHDRSAPLTVLHTVIRHIKNRSYLADVLACAITNVSYESLGEGNGLIAYLLRVCEIDLPTQVHISLLLSTLVKDSGWQREGQQYLKDRLQDVCHGGGISTLSENVARRLVTYLKANSHEYGEFLASFRMQIAETMAGDTPVHLRSLIETCSRDIQPVRDSLSTNSEGALAQLASVHDHAAFIEELGYACTCSLRSFSEIISLLPPLTERSVGLLLGMFARTYTGLENVGGTYKMLHAAFPHKFDSPSDSVKSWNIEVIVEVLQTGVTDICWTRVINCLDSAEFHIPASGALSFLIQVYRHATQEAFPIDAVCERLWSNIGGQLSFIKFAIVAPRELFSFKGSRHQQRPFDNALGYSLPPSTAKKCWFSLGIIKLLIQSAESGHYEDARRVLDVPLSFCPELLLIGFAQLQCNWNYLEQEIFNTLIPPYITAQPHSHSMIQQLWTLKQGAVLRAMVDAYSLDKSTMSRICDICKDLKALTDVLDLTPNEFAIELAALAARRDYLKLEKWLVEQIQARGTPFTNCCVHFLHLHACSATAAAADARYSSFVTLTEDIAAQFLIVLQHMTPSMTSENQETMSKIYKAAISTNPNMSRIISESSSHPHSSDVLPASDTFTRDVEDEANTYFQKLYTAQISVHDTVYMLKTFQASEHVREQKIFACMIHNLFDEYRFFPKYPERELRITAKLFGLVIKNQLLSTSVTLGLALRYVLDALRKPSGTKMFTFGCEALGQFKQRLLEWPQFCQQLLNLSHVGTKLPALFEHLQRDALGSGKFYDTSISSKELVLKTTENSTVIKQPQFEGWSRVSDTVSVQTESAALNKGDKEARPNIQKNDQLMVSQGSEVKQVLKETYVEERRLSSHREATRKHGEPVSSAISETTNISKESSSQAQKLSSNTTAKEQTRSNVRQVGFATSLNIDTLLAAYENSCHQQPEQHTLDRTHFIFNNSSVANLDCKASELRQLLSEADFGWFATYVVVKRAAIEPNFHTIYLGLLDQLSNKELLKMVLAATYRNIQILIHSELIKTNSGERSLLKNLGSWLGKLTIERCRPVLQKDIDLKELAVEAFETGRMIAVIPFVAKVLEPARCNKVFAPPNPWVIALLALLAEVYAETDLKLNLKFEIERLFKHLNTEIKDVPPSNLLVGRVRERFSNPDFVAEKSNMQQVTSQVPSPCGPAPQEAVSSLNQAPASAIPKHQAATASDTATSVCVDSEGKVTQTLNKNLQNTSGISAASSQVTTQASKGSESAGYLNNITGCIQINPTFKVLAERLQIKRLLPLALDRSIRDIISPVVERSVTIACMTTRELIAKDFSAEQDESRMRRAAHLMVSSLSGSLALVTCKEPLRVSVNNQLRQLVQQSMQQLNAAASVEQGILEQAIQILTGENLEIGCALIEQAATEKAVRSIDDALSKAYLLRRNHRELNNGLPFFDVSQLQGRYPSALPDSLRPTTSRITKQHRVYDDFMRLSRNITTISSASPGSSHPGTSHMERLHTSGFPTTMQTINNASAHHATHGLSTDNSRNPTHTPRQSGSDLLYESKSLSGDASFNFSASADKSASNTASVGDRVNALLQTLDSLIAKEPHSQLDALPANHNIRILTSEIGELLSHTSVVDEHIYATLSHIIKSLFAKSHSTPFSRAVYLAILCRVQGIQKLISQEINALLVSIESDSKITVDTVFDVARAHLINVHVFDDSLSKILTTYRKESAEYCACLLLHCITVDSFISAAELPKTFDSVATLRGQHSSFDKLNLLLEQTLSHSQSTRKADSDTYRQIHNRGTTERLPPGTREQVAQLFDEWAHVCELSAGEARYTTYFAGLQASGMLSSEHSQERFFRILTEMAVAHCLGSEHKNSSGQVSQLNFAAIDALVLLILSTVRTYTDVLCGQSNTPAGIRAGLLARILLAIVGTLTRDADERGALFNSRPYLRLFAGIMTELNAPDGVFDMSTEPVIWVLGHSLLTIQPARVPAFSLAWLELIAHRCYLPRLLTHNRGSAWVILQKLLCSILFFMEPFLRNAELTEPIRLLYKGTLRVLLVLLHDFPEFLCDHHFSLCNAIPFTCIQMRNLVLSAFPRNMRLPDPFTPNLKVDLLPEISQSPSSATKLDDLLNNHKLQLDLEHYLHTRQPYSFISDLHKLFLQPPTETVHSGTRYNIKLVNATVLYVGVQAVNGTRKDAATPLSHSAPMELFHRLTGELDFEGRYIFFNAIANQLRYPNNHTHYFSCVLLYLFAEANYEATKEQITRVLLERLIVNRPHPWGLLITFIELIKNPRYNFWNHRFTRCAPEIERLFESVARSCMGPGKGEGHEQLSAGPVSTLEVRPTAA
eukprot:CAMPEP_0183795892 /NCGR_PEP_ID=MMETSP0803_2-20130417/5376_1 /TAXON_ID=195967 /ORGANISM="Crustomastix stigmata, Strain CCMP3273" /LENGTH=2386 /DNA_ID=CAMNT_0026040399 /DNA_START=42 /DNA_END=7202 /DNA_ORIENTATION=-